MHFYVYTCVVVCTHKLHIVTYCLTSRGLVQHKTERKVCKTEIQIYDILVKKSTTSRMVSSSIFSDQRQFVPNLYFSSAESFQINRNAIATKISKAEKSESTTFYFPVDWKFCSAYATVYILLYIKLSMSPSLADKSGPSPAERRPTKQVTKGRVATKSK